MPDPAPVIPDPNHHSPDDRTSTTKDRPYTIVRTALSLDGYIDDASPTRLVLSNEAELALADEARASCDAILVGAGTLRADDPRLRVRSAALIEERLRRGRPAQPLRVTLTTGGDLDLGRQFFREDPDEAEPGQRRPRAIVFCPRSLASKLTASLAGRAEVVASSPSGSGEVDPAFVLSHLRGAGVERLLIEGGTRVNTLFLARGLADELQIAIAPFFVGDPSAPRLVGPGRFVNDSAHRMALADVRVVGDMAVLRYRTRQTA